MGLRKKASAEADPAPTGRIRSAAQAGGRAVVSALSAASTSGDITEIDTEDGMIELLRERYTRIRPGTDADRYVRAQHARLPAVGGWSSGHAQRIADYVVWDTYGEAQLIGHEIKVSRADWLAELRTPAKAEAWRRYCHLWYLVVPDLSIISGDLPEGWGLMAPDSTGKLRVKVRSETRDPEPMPPICQAQLARSIAKTARIERPFGLVSDLGSLLGPGRQPRSS